MPAFLPGIQSWDVLDSNGTISGGNLQKRLTLPAHGYFRSPGFDCAAGLLKYVQDGTVTEATLGRSSAGRLNSRDDSALILPGSSEWAAVAQYNPGAGTKPSAQGWTNYGGFTEPNPSGGSIRLVATTGLEFWILQNALTAGDLHIGHMRFSRASGAVGTQGFTSYLPVAANNVYRWLVHPDGSLTEGQTAQTVPGLTFATATKYDLYHVVRLNPAHDTITQSTVFARAAGSYGVDDLTGVINYGTLLGGTVNANTLAWGAYNADGASDFTYDVVRFWNGVEWLTLTDGQAPPSGPNRQFWQIKCDDTGPTETYLTEIDLQADLTIPGTPGSVGLTAITGNRVAIYSADVAGASAYEQHLHDAADDSLIADCLSEDPACLVDRDSNGDPIPDGNYYAMVRACTDDGVRGPAATTGNITLPAAEPSVAVTVSPATVAPSATSAASAVIAGGATATLNGSPWDGSSTTVVTGTGGALIGPTAPAPVIGNLLVRAAPVLGDNTPQGNPAPSTSWSGSTMKIYYLATQPTTYTLQRRAYPSGASWATDSTQGTPTINVSALTYNGSTPGVSYATNHGWTLLTNNTYEYRINPTYSDGSTGLPSPALLPNSRADYEIAVSGVLPTGQAAATVSVELSEIVVIGGRTYPKTGYSATVASDGTYAVQGLPRLAAASQPDGGSSTLYATFTFPDRSKVRKVLPDLGSATFESLTAA